MISKYQIQILFPIWDCNPSPSPSRKRNLELISYHVPVQIIWWLKFVRLQDNCISKSGQNLRIRFFKSRSKPMLISDAFVRLWPDFSSSESQYTRLAIAATHRRTCSAHNCNVLLTGAWRQSLVSEFECSYWKRQKLKVSEPDIAGSATIIITVLTYSISILKFYTSGIVFIIDFLAFSTLHTPIYECNFSMMLKRSLLIYFYITVLFSPAQ